MFAETEVKGEGEKEERETGGRSDKERKGVRKREIDKEWKRESGRECERECERERA